MSTKFSPTAVWRIRTSPGPGLPSVTSSQTRTSGPPVLWKRMACVMGWLLRWDEKREWVAGGSGLDDDVAVLDMNREGLGHIGALLQPVRSLAHFFGKFLAAFDRDRIGADLEALWVEPGLPVAHVEFPAVPGTAQELADP